METTPAFKYILEYITNTFPDMEEKERKANAHKWVGLTRTVRFQEWVDKQTKGINK